MGRPHYLTDASLVRYTAGAMGRLKEARGVPGGRHEGEKRMSAEADLRDYVARVERAYRDGNATEHTYRPDLKTLLEHLAPGTTATNEPKRRTDCGAPDYVITRGSGASPRP